MLRWFDSEKNLAVDDIPHMADYERWKSQLTSEDLDHVFAHIEKLIETGNVQTSSWMPGSDWTDTPLRVIYETATNMSEQQAGWCFGLMLMETMIQQEEQWYCKKDPEVAEGTVYWRAHR